MKLQELFLIETSDEDRALISLSSSIYAYIQKYANIDIDYDNEDDESEEIVRVGKIGSLFDTPIDILNSINIELQSDAEIEQRANRDNESVDVTKLPGTDAPLALWYGHINTIVLNSDYLQSNMMKTTITHELRHALDDHKSEFKANRSKSYSTPKNKEHRKTNSEFGNLNYFAQPAEINARFIQVLHTMVPAIKRAMKLDPDQQRSRIMTDFNKSMNDNLISNLFPEKEKSKQSKQYKQLIKRAMDFIEKEIKHNQQLPANNN